MQVFEDETMNQSIACCKNKPDFEIEYLTGETFLVCSECFKKQFWNRYIKSKKDLEVKEN